MTRRISNWLFILIFLTFAVLLFFIGNWIIDALNLPKGLFGVWVIAVGVLGMDVISRFTFINYVSVFTFMSSLGAKDKFVFWGSLFAGSLPFIIYYQFSGLQETSAFYFMALVLTVLLIYSPIRVFGSNKLKERILEKKQ